MRVAIVICFWRTDVCDVSVSLLSSAKMADNGPNKSDIEAIFKRLRSIPTNKTCFDCGAKNPTWSSVTYGVFICIDCSAVHRSLGVHITFVRSTQLDTAWTWPQLRNMQLGGNANAHSFFHQHNCTSSDAQQKYKSRAAQLYKEKLANMSAQAMRIYGNQVHIETGHSNEQAAPEKKELDFFTEAESEAFNKLSYEPQAPVTPISTASKEQQPTEAPNVEALINAGDAAKPAGKSIIAQRKTVAKKPGLGAKKGLGAMKIQTNFEDIEREAQMADQLRTKAPEPQAKAQEPDDKQMASLRLAYQDLSVETKKQTEKLQKVDPNKAQQMERLGMGILSSSSGTRNVSHSALSDMQVIQQDSSAVNSSSVLASLDRKKSPLMDEYSSPSSSIFNKGSGIDDLFSSKPTSSYDDRWDMLEELSQPAASKQSSSYSSSSSVSSAPRSSGYGKPAAEPAANSGEALKKFGNAKAISSDQFFQDSAAADYERRSNLSRFEGSSSISSADYFGTGSGSSGASARGYAAGRPAAYNLQAPDFDEVKESVRQGVTKVASRLSNMANNLASSIQERYGY